MIDRPILFSTPMVQAILEGRKTVTRRVVTRGNSTVSGVGASKELWDRLEFDRAWVDRGFPDEDGQRRFGYLHVPERDTDGVVHRVRSRIEDGDRLWVREAWGIRRQTIEEARELDEVCFRADPVESWFLGRYQLWRPSIFMPRWACRATLPVLAVRGERLHEISEDDVAREGVVFDTLAYDPISNQQFAAQRAPLKAFEDAWDQINAKRGHPWEKNDWVWRFEFERGADG